MQRIFDEYFKDYPVKKKIVCILYENGISIRDDKFYLNNIEIPLSSIANAIKVNRRTLYETIKFVNNNFVIKKIMENLSVITDIKQVSLLMKNEVVTIYIEKGYYSKVFLSVVNVIGKYASSIKEIYSVNSNYENGLIRIIFYNKINSGIFSILNDISGIQKIIINSPEQLDVICDKCEIRECPHKISSSID
ncbi:MAG: hypothetical protein QXZ44_06585 [Ferroplasma sp.]